MKLRLAVNGASGELWTNPVWKLGIPYPNTRHYFGETCSLRLNASSLTPDTAQVSPFCLEPVSKHRASGERWTGKQSVILK
jgi:hypothetical protein